ncbi:ribonucleotide reductase inhibitor-domain-containing protein [Daldinia caldariorum]|uniref:ribonucleotide reductase inhibitor-domain-containing protein n=1 Tax=Daldinia caldariorum TaxID=326644 RepID=UPI002008B2C6|nr:ribonucleotide reductase inhibitor-domain-containing protein [Daldinia caldariorum]KAI1472476.1 ribonucleotide reductase inhibitor-domain-containing protein [Daldinia caldariorum]
MSAPRTKRQFAGAASDPAQRQITSFFTTQQPDYSSSINHTSSRAQNPSGLANPSLPASVQANLLSVGMRVRKSVPEGYKTGSYSAFGLWDERNNNNTNNKITTSGSAAVMGEGRSRANAISTSRELLPFCGIHKVGGLSPQPEITTQSFPPPPSYQPLLSLNGGPLNETMDEDVPGLTSSQDSVESTGSSISRARTRKRSYTEDEDETPQTPGRLNLDFNTWLWSDRFDGEVSPRSVAPAGWSAGNGNGNGNGRVMAIPRKAKLRGTKLAAAQENVRVVNSVDGSDFEEADFLVETSDLGYEHGSRGWEVEMSDV